MAAHLPRPSKALLGTVIAIVLGILAMTPTLGAFTSQWVGITARVTQPPTVNKSVLPDPQITQDEVDTITQAYTGVTGCLAADTEFPIEVPAQTCVWWVLRITVTNSTGGDMHDVMVVDRFGAELGVNEFLDYVPVEAIPIFHSRGRSSSGLAPFETQFRVVWCVTDGEPGAVDPINDDTCIDPVPPQPLLPGESEFIDLLVFTKLNPSGKQEYTTPGTYTMNSGATVTWEQGAAGGPQGSDSTSPIAVTAVCSNPCSDPDPTPTPTPTPSPMPTPTPTPGVIDYGISLQAKGTLKNPEPGGTLVQTHELQVQSYGTIADGPATVSLDAAATHAGCPDPEVNTGPLSVTLEPGTTARLEFTVTYYSCSDPSPRADYELTASVSAPGDENAENDTAVKEVNAK
jgi:hypothetical protein